MNQNPEQSARDNIDKQLRTCGWVIQNLREINLGAGVGVAVREYPTAEGPADYILFVDRRPVGVIEAKRIEAGVKLTVVEEQSFRYATSKLKHLNNDILPFVYESTGAVTHFTDCRDPKPRSMAAIFDTTLPQPWCIEIHGHLSDAARIFTRIP